MCACVSEDGPCYWLRVDYSRGEGVCSRCPERVAEWDAAIRRKSIDDQFIELMDALDGYDSPEAISQRLAELQDMIRTSRRHAGRRCYSTELKPSSSRPRPTSSCDRWRAVAFTPRGIC